MSTQTIRPADTSRNTTPLLLSPGALGRLAVRNRVVMAPIDSVIRTEEGGSTERHMHYLAARARGGVGLIVMDNAIVRWPEGSVGSKSLRIDQDRFIASLNEVVEEVHHHGALIAAQINHAGRQTTLGGSQGVPLVSASAIGWPDSGTTPRELTLAEIGELRAEFLDAAVRTAKAGFDAVQVHAAHGYLLSSFLSPALNQRSDQYGGSTANRARLVREIISDIQDALPDLPIIVRMNCVDGVPGGVDEQESVEIAGILAATGIDGLDVSAGTYESSGLTFPPMMLGEGYIMNRIKRIKDAVDVPVVGVGRIVRPDTAERYLADGSVDFVALGRALIADPEWTNKADRGRSQTIRHCIGCNHGCIRRIDLDLSMKCNVNPDLGHEGRDRTPPARRSRHIVVAGAGPAGVEFSVRAASSGHRVDLFESSAAVGGQLVYAQVPDFKRDLGSLRDYYETVLSQAAVEVHLNTPLTPEDVERLSPDLVVLATGADPIGVDEVLDGSAVPTVTFEEVLTGSAQLRGPVVVLGGGPNGCETAIFIAKQGIAVTVVEMRDELVRDEDHTIRDWVKGAFHEFGVKYHLESTIAECGDKAVVVQATSGERFELPTGTVVSAVGMRPRGELAERLRGDHHIPVEVIGDARRVGTILDATEQAAWLVERLTVE